VISDRVISGRLMWQVELLAQGGGIKQHRQQWMLRLFTE